MNKAIGIIGGLAGVAILIYAFTPSKSKSKAIALKKEDDGVPPTDGELVPGNVETISMVDSLPPPPPPDVAAIKLDKGEKVYSRFNRVGVYTKPIRKLKYLKNKLKLYKKFDEIGTYFEESSELGWSKVYVPKFKDNPYLFVQSQNLTDVKTL